MARRTSGHEKGWEVITIPMVNKVVADVFGVSEDMLTGRHKGSQYAATVRGLAMLLVQQHFQGWTDGLVAGHYNRQGMSVYEARLRHKKLMATDTAYAEKVNRVNHILYGN